MTYPYTKPIFRDKGLTQTRNKLTDDKIDCVLEKDNSKKNFKYYLKVHLGRYENLASHSSSYKIVAYVLGKIQIYGRITGEFLGFTMRNFQGIIFI